MTDKDLESEGPSLELPSLFGRRRKSKQAPENAPENASEASSEPPPQSPESVAPVEVPDATEIAPVGEQVVTSPPAPETAPAEAAPPAAAEQEPAAERTQVLTPAAVAAPAAEAQTNAPAAEGGSRKARKAQKPAREKPIKAPKEKAPRPPVEMPHIDPGPATAIVGAVMGLDAVIFTWLGLQGCEAITGAESCGGPGIFVLAAIVVSLVLLGAAMLRLLRVPDAGSLSFLGVSVMCVVVLVFLLEALETPWTLLYMPILGLASFATARWVTTRFVDME